jgi:DNA-binding NarL/FixJ family response regulator
MFNNVIIATTAGFLADMLKEKLKDIDYKVLVASNDIDLRARIKSVYPRFVFIEQCFCENDTDIFIHKIMKVHSNLHIVIWAASDIKPVIAARFIHAGAESFFSFRNTSDNIEKILALISRGRHYCPADVEAVLKYDFSMPIFSEPITKRELQIIKLFGNSDVEIAKILSLSVSTVKFHKTNIYRKFGGKRKNEILIEAVKKGLVLPEEL